MISRDWTTHAVSVAALPPMRNTGRNPKRAPRREGTRAAVVRAACSEWGL